MHAFCVCVCVRQKERGRERVGQRKCQRKRISGYVSILVNVCVVCECWMKEGNQDMLLNLLAAGVSSENSPGNDARDAHTQPHHPILLL